MAALSGGQLTPRAFGQGPRGLSAVGFEHRQALPAGPKAGSSQGLSGKYGLLPDPVEDRLHKLRQIFRTPPRDQVAIHHNRFIPVMDGDD